MKTENFNKMSNKEILRAACSMINYKGYNCQSVIVAIVNGLTKKTPSEKVCIINYLKSEFAKIY